MIQGLFLNKGVSCYAQLSLSLVSFILGWGIAQNPLLLMRRNQTRGDQAQAQLIRRQSLFPAWVGSYLAKSVQMWFDIRVSGSEIVKFIAYMRNIVRSDIYTYT